MQKAGIHQTSQETNSLCYKELWIFWYGEEPDFSGMVLPNLSEAEQGSWESGLSYECRTLLFKALHNLIERCLLSRGYTRLGQYYIEPQVVDVNSKKKNQIAFALHFFIHGESTVCASVDFKLRPSVYALNKCHIAASQTGHKGIKVILSPFGMEAKLTGHSYKYSDPNMAHFLHEWNSFFPLCRRRGKLSSDNEFPNVIEVSIGGARMKYPASYVLVTEEDHKEAFHSHGNSTTESSIFPTLCSTFKPNHIQTPGLLTPPMSPAENETFRDTSGIFKNVLNDALSIPKNYVRLNPSEYPCAIKHSVSQECCTPLLSDKADDSSVLWDFHDPTAVVKCTCSRKFGKMKSFSRRSSGIAFDTSMRNYLNSASQKSHRNEKDSHFTRVPFHKQKQNQSSEAEFLSNAYNSVLRNNSIKSVANNFGSCNVGTNMISLPQLHTTVTQPKNESLSNDTSSDNFYSQVSTLDPVMPTLSPQPPVVKEENSFELAQANVSSPCIDSPQCVTLKGKISDEILSPFHTSLLNMFENAKNVSKFSAPLGHSEFDPIEQKSITVLSNDIDNDHQVVEKPHLPKRCHEDNDDALMTMRSLLYDYRHMNSPFWNSSSLVNVTHLKSEKELI